MPSSNHLACRALAGAQSRCLLHATADAGLCSFQVPAADCNFLERRSLQGLPALWTRNREKYLDKEGPELPPLQGVQLHLVSKCCEPLEIALGLPVQRFEDARATWPVDVLLDLDTGLPSALEFSSWGEPGMDHQARRAGVLRLFTWPSRGGRHAPSTNAKPSLVRAMSTGAAQLPCSATYSTMQSLRAQRHSVLSSSLNAQQCQVLHQPHRSLTRDVAFKARKRPPLTGSSGHCSRP